MIGSKKTRPPCILQLPGITIDDCKTIDDIALQKYASDVNNTQTSTVMEIKYTKNPSVFTGFETWPRKTDLLCWNCHFSFDRPPVFIPTYISEPDAPIRIGVLGNMCSFSCAARWILVNYNQKNGQLWRAQDGLKFLYQIFHGVTPKDIIKPSPPYTDQIQYGGHLTKEKYCEIVKELNKVSGIPCCNNNLHVSVYGGDVSLKERNLKIDIWDDIDEEKEETFDTNVELALEKINDDLEEYFSTLALE